MATDLKSTGSGIKKKLIKISVIAGIVFVFILGIVFYVRHFYTYSDGYRSGVLQKFSRRGALFKTYEGEIIQNVTTNNNMILSTDKFLFSVINQDVAKKLEQLQGKTITVHYQQKYNSLFWRGDSEYIVDEVKE